MNENGHGSGCFTEILAALVFLWVLFHWDEVQRFLDRLVAT